MTTTFRLRALASAALAASTLAVSACLPPPAPVPGPVPGSPATTAVRRATTISSTTTTVRPTTTSTSSTTSSTTTSTTASTTTTSTTTSTTVPAAPLPVGPTGFRTLAFADEFSGTALDTSRWSAYSNTYGSANNELECNSPRNVSVSNGTLKIVSRRETVTCGDGRVRDYTSAFLGSREAGRYYPREAYFEMRARVPHAQGVWPAFWLRHRNGAATAEVDVMEYFHSQVPGKVTSTLHLDGTTNVFKRTTSFEAPTATSGWHTFGVAVQAVPTGQQFTFYLDGAATGSFVDTDPVWASTGDAAAMFDIAVNQAVGGNWAGRPDGTLGELPDVSRCSISGTYPGGCTATGIRRWAGAAPGGSETFEVDYVRVFTH